MKVLSCEDMSALINIALGSAKLRSLNTPFSSIRPQIHIMIDGRIGSGKSKILYDVGKAIKQMPVTGLTKANILGTVDADTKEFVFPAVWDARDSALLVDEFDVNVRDYPGRTAIKTMLILMENPEYSKRISFAPKEYKKRTKGLYCIVKDGKISCKTRFIFFGNTMMDISGTRMTELKALASRCIIIPHYPSLEDLKRKARGEPSYIYKKINPKNVDCVISEAVYLDILKYVDSKSVKETKYFRTIGDLCRVYAVIGRIDEHIFNLIIELAED